MNSKLQEVEKKIQARIRISVTFPTLTQIFVMHIEAIRIQWIEVKTCHAMQRIALTLSPSYSAALQQVCDTTQTQNS